jgi:HAD superfamily hydrolase (TIGR01509 family)
VRTSVEITIAFLLEARKLRLKPRKVNVLIFDIGGVLINWRSNDPIFRYIAQRFGIPFSEMKRALEKNFRELESGRISANDWTSLALSEFGRTMTKPEEADELLLTPFASRATVKKGTAEIIRSIRNQSYRVFALTNTSFTHLDYMRSVGWPKLFDGFYSSCELGCAKPDREIYRKTLDLIGARPDQAVFVDDKPENVLGAKKVGIRNSIAFHSVVQLRREISGLIGKQELARSFLKRKVSERS